MQLLSRSLSERPSRHALPLIGGLGRGMAPCPKASSEGRTSAGTPGTQIRQRKLLSWAGAEAGNTEATRVQEQSALGEALAACHDKTSPRTLTYAAPHLPFCPFPVSILPKSWTLRSSRLRRANSLLELLESASTVCRRHLASLRFSLNRSFSHSFLSVPRSLLEKEHKRLHCGTAALSIRTLFPCSVPLLSSASLGKACLVGL